MGTTFAPHGARVERGSQATGTAGSQSFPPWSGNQCSLFTSILFYSIQVTHLVLGLVLRLELGLEVGLEVGLEMGLELRLKLGSDLGFDHGLDLGLEP